MLFGRRADEQKNNGTGEVVSKLSETHITISERSKSFFGKLEAARSTDTHGQDFISVKVKKVEQQH